MVNLNLENKATTRTLIASTRVDRITTNAYMIDKLVESLYMIFQ